MAEYIESITEISDGGMDGFEVLTSDQSILLGISNYQSCCERTGYFWCNDSTAEFIGARLLDVTITDTALITSKAPDIYEGGVMFVNLVTDRGVLQFVCYNEHNGYYGHTARVDCKQLTHQTCI